MRHMRTMRRAGVAAVLSSALILTLSACGGDGDEASPKGSTSSAPAGSKGEDKASSTPESVPSTPSEPIATVKGDKGVEMSLFSARRDEGGFLTLDGVIKNTGAEQFTTPVQWSGLEQSVAATGRSFARHDPRRLGR
ncbi:hypothetical protein QFZ68_004465 [Streptomyces sp. V1I6]|nr:hypothetical protein [Streptomyces sp. V1I6]